MNLTRSNVRIQMAYRHVLKKGKPVRGKIDSSLGTWGFVIVLEETQYVNCVFFLEPECKTPVKSKCVENGVNIWHY